MDTINKNAPGDSGTQVVRWTVSSECVNVADDSDLMTNFGAVVKGHTDIGFYVTLSSVNPLNVVDDANTINDENVQKDQTRENDNVNAQEGLGTRAATRAS